MIGTAPTARRLTVAVALALAWASRGLTQQTDDVVGRAMRDELTRSMKELRLAQLERPYYIAYRVQEAQSLNASASYGSLLGSHESRLRTLSVEVRVGDYAFDNTNFFGGGGMMMSVGFGGFDMSFESGELPLDDNYLEIRRQLWLATDAAYKEAVETLAAKRASLLNRARTDSLADFTREQPTQTSDDEMASALPDRARIEALLRELSRVPELTALYSSGITLTATNARTRFLNSEGTSYSVSRPLITLSASGSTQAVDGQSLGGSLQFVARSETGLPQRDELFRQVRALGLHLDSLRGAPAMDRYSGPILFEGRAAAELFSQQFAPALAGQRRPGTGDPSMSMMLERAAGRGGGSFTEKIGSRVLPEFLTVIDDPKTGEQRGVPLLGTYKVDDDGVAGRRKIVIENGILKSLLTTRNPVEGFDHSSGNDRGFGAGPSNLIVETGAGESEAQLKAHLLTLAKKRGLAYGVIVRELGSGSAMIADDPMSMMSMMRDRGAGGRSIFLAYKVYPDGREQLVRSARLTDVSAQSFKDVVAASSSPIIYAGGAGSRGPFGMMVGMFGGAVGLSSYVVPSLLFEDLALTKAMGELPKPPLSAPPGVDGRR